uniref:Odorant-binding protein 11 n=1 Tax=Matsumurasca onukii TaxID=2912585 RepID=A0A343WGW3_MATON|nr:odorant-binding protein 11 [Matsumurasca onukii]
MKTINLFSIVVLCCVHASVQEDMSDQHKEIMQKLHNTCVQETGVSEDAISNAAKGTFAEDGKLSCYMKCLVVQLGVFSEEDGFDSEAFVEMVPDHMKETMSEVVNKCTPLSGSTSCDKIFQFNKCFYNVNPQKFVIF